MKPFCAAFLLLILVSCQSNQVGTESPLGLLPSLKQIEEAGREKQGKRVLLQNFEIPELGRLRDIWIFTPHGYEESGDSYPVLYLQDGQNLFGQKGGSASEWKVDETLNGLKALGLQRGLIVVAVAHGRELREQEYVPALLKIKEQDHPLYMKFLATTLKSYVDQRYRTLPDKENTLIGGSSFGGHLSLRAALAHPEVYGKVLAFSPSLWPGDFSLVQAFRQSDSLAGQTFYLDIGTAEGSPSSSQEQVRLLKNFAQTLRDKKADGVHLVVEKDGRHHENDWRRRFPLALAKIFGFKLP